MFQSVLTHANADRRQRSRRPPPIDYQATQPQRIKQTLWSPLSLGTGGGDREPDPEARSATAACRSASAAVQAPWQARLCGPGAVLVVAWPFCFSPVRQWHWFGTCPANRRGARSCSNPLRYASVMTHAKDDAAESRISALAW